MTPRPGAGKVVAPVLLVASGETVRLDGKKLSAGYGVLSAGDLDGDGIDELAVVDESPGPPGLRLFALNSP